MREDEMAGWHHRLNGHEFEKTPGDSVPTESQRVGHKCLNNNNSGWPSNS